MITRYGIRLRQTAENDIVGKYIEKFITFEKEKPKSGITKEFLLKNGF